MRPILWIGFLTLALGALGTATEVHKEPLGQLASPAVLAADVYVDQLPGVRTGTVSARQRVANTSILNAYLATGRLLRLHAGTRVEIAGELKVASGGGILGDMSGDKPTIYMPANAFTNTDPTVDRGRYGPNAVGIDFSGELSGQYRPSTGVRIANLRLVSEAKPGRILHGIVGRNVVGCVIENVEIRGLPTAIGIALASARDCRVRNIYIHDFYDDTRWPFLPQSTGIEVDNDTVHGIGSRDTEIDHFRIDRLRVGGGLLAKWGYQTDGINLFYSARRTRISDGEISDVGEGIDTYGSDGAITHVRIDRPYIFGLKFIHGASRNRARGITINDAGLAGVNFSGSNEARQDTAGNVISGLAIKNIDPLGTWRKNSTAGVLVSGANARRLPIHNEVIDATIDLGPDGKYGWLDDSTGTANRGTGLRITGGRSLDRKILILHGGGSASLGPTQPR